jgi:membrane glycosyltransferase
LAARWEVQMAQLLVVDIDSALTGQAMHRVAGW